MCCSTGKPIQKMALNVIIFSYFFPAVLSGKFFCVWGKYHVYLLPTNGKEMKTTGYTFSLFFFFFSSPNCSNIFTQHSLGPLNHPYLKYGLSA